jgi:hypothetical protein
MCGDGVPTSAGRVFDEAAAELEALWQLLADGLQASDLAHERRFRQTLQRVAECCEEHESVMTASRVLRTVAVRAFAKPDDPVRLQAMHAVLTTLTELVEQARAALIRTRIARYKMKERPSQPRDERQ